MPVRKSDRLFQLTNLLRAHQPLTARELATRLCVSERTIYRYIDDLSLAGIPVYGEAGLGYRLSEGFEMAPLQLSAAELEALITGVNLVAVLTGKGMADPARSLLAKIEAALPAKDGSGDSRPRGAGAGLSYGAAGIRSLGQVARRHHGRALAANRLPGCQRQQDRNASSIPWGSSTGADAGRSAPGARCVEPTGISGWIASTPWRRAARGKARPRCDPGRLPCPATVGCIPPATDVGGKKAIQD
jgi:biotin operon repressor